MSTYAISDLHGRFDLYQEVVKFLKPEDKVICLGDCCDRGLNSWETLSAVYDNPQFTLLCGNHEHLLAHSIIQYYTGESTYYEDAMTNLASDGGLETFEKWLDLGANREWARKLLYLPKVFTYENSSGICVTLSHAGFTPSEEVFTYKLLWDRDHMEEDWPKDKEYEQVLIVHGHTPVQFITEKSNNIVWYGQGHKIDIDCGSVWSGVTCLFDLDTLEEHYFTIQNDESRS